MKGVTDADIGADRAEDFFGKGEHVARNKDRVNLARRLGLDRFGPKIGGGLDRGVAAGRVPGDADAGLVDVV